MSRPTFTLLIILLVQCAVTASFYWPESIFAQMRNKAPLASFNPDFMDEIHVNNGQNNEVIVVKVNGHWLVPELGGLPADTQMITKMLEALTAEPHGRPVADTIPARQRFQVAAYHYQRRLSITSNGELTATIYLGTSPGFRKVHARNDSSDSIYSIPFNIFEAPAFASGWLQRSLLQSNNIQRVKAPNYSLQLTDQGWRAANGIGPDYRELEALLLALGSLQADGVAEEDDQRSLSQATPGLILEIEADGATQQLEFFTDGQRHFVYSSKYPLFFTISDYDFDRIIGIDADLLRAEFSIPGPVDVNDS
ncbi:MAG: hypothetical protein ACJA09_003763 [Alcanivorax sp.]|jgi:hypothetical protein